MALDQPWIMLDAACLLHLGTNVVQADHDLLIVTLSLAKGKNRNRPMHGAPGWPKEGVHWTHLEGRQT